MCVCVTRTSQVLHTYGDLSDSQLLQTYGFIDIDSETPTHTQNTQHTHKQPAYEKAEKQEEEMVTEARERTRPNVGLGLKAGGGGGGEGGARGPWVNPHNHALVPVGVVMEICRDVLISTHMVRGLLACNTHTCTYTQAHTGLCW